MPRKRRGISTPPIGGLCRFGSVEFTNQPGPTVFVSYTTTSWTAGFKVQVWRAGATGTPTLHLTLSVDAEDDYDLLTGAAGGTWWAEVRGVRGELLDRSAVTVL